MSKVRAQGDEPQPRLLMRRGMSFAGVILAAGTSSRMGQEKALLRWGGQTFLAGHIEVLRAQSDFVIFVVGKNRPVLRPIAEGAGAHVAENPNPELGQFSSLQVGLREAQRLGCNAAIVSLVDRPPVRLETLALLRSSYEEASDLVWSVAPEYLGRRGHPIVVGPEMIAAFLAAPSTSTARNVRKANHAHCAYVRVDDPLSIQNIDVPEDYAHLAESNAARSL